MKKTVTLFLPGLLFENQNKPPQHLHALSRLLSRASLAPAPLSVALTLKYWFGGLGKGEIPSGALGALFYGLIERGSTALWCRVSPVTCLVDHQGAYITGNAQLQLTEEEITILKALISAFFEGDKLTLAIPKSSEWFCRLRKSDVVMRDLLDVIGKSLFHYLPSGPNQVFWHRLITECQMLLQTCAVNKQRLLKEQPPLSSLWFWGIGKLPQKIKSPFTAIYSNDSTIRGLALSAGVFNQNLPDAWDRRLMETTHQQVLFADMKFYELHKHQLMEECARRWEWYETNWFDPLLSGLKERDIDTLQLFFANGQFYQLRKANLRYFWKKIKPIEKFIN